MKFRSRVFALLCSILTFSAVGAITSVGTAQAAGGVLISNFGTGKCLTVEGASQVLGASIIQKTCANLPGQHWMLLGVPGGIRQVYNTDTGYCMTILNFENFGQVIQATCGSAHPGLFWKITNLGGVPAPQQKVTLKSYTTNFCLDLENGDPTDGVELQVWKCNSTTDNQRWRVS